MTIIALGGLFLIFFMESIKRNEALLFDCAVEEKCLQYPCCNYGAVVTWKPAPNTVPSPPDASSRARRSARMLAELVYVN